jgi:hypothetical protein
MAQLRGRQRARRLRLGRTHTTSTGHRSVGGYAMTLWISVVIYAIAAVLTYMLPAHGQKVAKGETDDQIGLLEEIEGDVYLALDEKG